MNTLRRPLYLLAVTSMVALLATGCDEERERRTSRNAEATISRSWPAGAIREVKVAETNGSISVEAAPVSEITLVANAHGDLEIRKGVENDGLFETKLEGDTLSIGRTRRHRRGFRIERLFNWKRERRIDYILRVPQKIDVALTTVNGKIVTRGVEGETRTATVNGAIDIETSGDRELSATTVNGRVHAKFMRSFHGARFKTVNGRVTAFLPQGASFNVDLSQVNGDFEAAFPLSINSNPGSRRVSGEVNGGEHELRIVTVNGDIELARLSEAPPAPSAPPAPPAVPALPDATQP
jgi:hypothetical protein